MARGDTGFDNVQQPRLAASFVIASRGCGFRPLQHMGTKSSDPGSMLEFPYGALTTDSARTYTFNRADVRQCSSQCGAIDEYPLSGGRTRSQIHRYPRLDSSKLSKWHQWYSASTQFGAPPASYCWFRASLRTSTCFRKISC